MNLAFNRAYTMMDFLFRRTLQNTKTASGTLVISNTFPPLLSNPRLMHITSILQMVTRYRTEKCCESLVWLYVMRFIYSMAIELQNKLAQKHFCLFLKHSIQFVRHYEVERNVKKLLI